MTRVTEDLYCENCGEPSNGTGYYDCRENWVEMCEGCMSLE